MDLKSHKRLEFMLERTRTDFDKSFPCQCCIVFHLSVCFWLFVPIEAKSVSILDQICDLINSKMFWMNSSNHREGLIQNFWIRRFKDNIMLNKLAIIYGDRECVGLLRPNFIFRHKGRTFENFEGWRFLVGPNLVEPYEFRWPEVLNLEFGFGTSSPTHRLYVPIFGYDS